MAIQVRDPADFSRRVKEEEAGALIEIQPIPLEQAVMRGIHLDHGALIVAVHFPHGEDHKAQCVEIALGWNFSMEVCKGKL